MDAMAVGSVICLPFIFFFIACVYMWFKRSQRFDAEVMLDCARRSGGAQSERLIRQELGTLSMTVDHSATDTPGTPRHAARGTQR